MWRFKHPLISTVCLIFVAIIFTSCQKEPTPVESNQDTNQFGLPKFALPEGATYVSATFNVLVIEPSSQNINVHRIISPWDELVVTWNNFGGDYAPSVEGSFNANSVGWHSVDVTSLVGSWLNGTISNYGLLLNQEDETYPRTVLDTREVDFGPNPAYLEICYTLNGEVLCDTTRTIGDTYIYELTPDANNGWHGLIYTGLGEQGDLDKQALFMFDLEFTSTSQGECTSVPFYWQLHTQYGPQPRDADWGLIQPNGENSEFFLSGKSYYQTLMQPAWFNDYYSLARQYIAAELNTLRGASIPSEIQIIFNSATNLLNTYTPVQVSGLYYWNPVRIQFRLYAFKLLKYNWGIVGPGRCYNCGQ